MKLLLLAGTREARQIATALAREPHRSVVVSLARPERVPRPFGLPARIGGFGGEAGFRHYLEKERIGAVLDATHPFAARMSARAAQVAEDMGLDYLQFLRPSWRPVEGDRWTFLNDLEDAAGVVPPDATVFVATGRGSLGALRDLTTQTVYCRVLAAAGRPFPFNKGSYIPGIAPFLVPEEVDLFRKLGVEWIITQNSGGSGGKSKLDAARKLGLSVAMLRRPPQPEGPKVDTVAAALAWAHRRQ